MTIQDAESTAALLASLVAVLSVLMSAKGKWDKTNFLLTALVSEVKGNEQRHQATHARMDRRADQFERRLYEHIGRHRRPLGDRSQKVVYNQNRKTIPGPLARVRGFCYRYPMNENASQENLMSANPSQALRYTVTIELANGTERRNVDFNDQPHINESIWYMGLQWNVISFVQNF